MNHLRPAFRFSVFGLLLVGSAAAADREEVATGVAIVRTTLSSPADSKLTASGTYLVEEYNASCSEPRSFQKAIYVKLDQHCRIDHVETTSMRVSGGTFDVSFQGGQVNVLGKLDSADCSHTVFWTKMFQQAVIQLHVTPMLRCTPPSESPVMWSELDLDARRPRLLAGGESGMRVRDVARSEGIVVMSGGFLASFFPPVAEGLLRIGGKLQSADVKEDLYNGVACFRPERRGHPGAYVGAVRQAPPGWLDCFRSGPVLVSGGRVAADFKRGPFPVGFYDSFQRAFLGINRTGRLVLGIADRATLAQLAELLAKSTEAGGAGLVDAINLSAGGSAGLLVKASSTDERQVGNVDIRLPYLVVVR